MTPAEHGLEHVSAGQNQPQFTCARRFLGHSGDHRASAASSASGISSAIAMVSSTDIRSTLRTPRSTWDTHATDRRTYAGQLRLGQTAAAPFGGDLPAESLLIVRGAQVPVPLPVWRVSQFDLGAGQVLVPLGQVAAGAGDASCASNAARSRYSS